MPNRPKQSHAPVKLPARPEPATPPRVRVAVNVPGSQNRLSSVHYTGPGEALTLCGYEKQQTTAKVVACAPTEDALGCTKCARLVEEACQRPGFGGPEHVAALKRGIALSQIGVAGVTAKGGVVDRREVPEALPIPANSMMDVPKPWKLGPKLEPGARGPVKTFLDDAERIEFEMGSSPDGDTDCGKRGINHLMRRESSMLTRCISPDCDAVC